MHQESLIAQMQAIFDDFQRVNPHIRVADFTDVDLPLIRFYSTAHSNFIWVLNPYGTHLNPVGLHARGNNDAIASIECAESAGYSFALYYISNSHVRPISPSSGKEAAKQLRYQTKNSIVTRSSDKRHLATTKVELLDRQLHARIDIASLPEEQLTTDDLVALYHIAVCEAVEAAHSLWVKPQAILLNGDDLYDLIMRRQNASVDLRRAA